MEILLLDALVPEATAWLEKHHRVYFRPELVGDLAGLKQAGHYVCGIVVPRQTVVTSALLNCLPRLKVLDRMHVDTDNLDLDACKARGIKVIHASSASVRSNAEFLLTVLLLCRRGVVSTLGSWFELSCLQRRRGVMKQAAPAARAVFPASR